MGLIKFALRILAPVPKVEAFERYLFVGPHPDDIEIGAGATAAKLQAVAFYMTAKPNRYVKTSGYVEKQLDALFGCHLSQFPKGDETGKMIGLYLKLRSVGFGIKTLKGCAEGFRMLGMLHMHCMPESEK